MTAREVEGVLGVPPGDYEAGAFRIYGGVFTEGPETAREQTWIGQDVIIRVCYAPDADRVVYTECSYILRARVGWLEWARRFVGG